MSDGEGVAGHGAWSIPLRPEWDATLTYALLESPPALSPAADGEPLFVGRDDLLGGVVNAIGQPDRRGTYLISGYRGVGKTSLVIEAARRARERLPEGWQLLPIVLNVSEVSASLDDAGTATGSKPLHIDARKLLTALLRELRNRMAQVSRATTAPDSGMGSEEAVRDSVERLREKIVQTCRKAEAAQFQQKEHSRVDATWTVTSERKRSLDIANLMTVVGVIAGLAAGALQGFLIARSLAGALQVTVVALAGACVVSLHRARSVSRTTTQASGSETEIVLDNSLHQLESDLKDILAELHRLRWRTVIVLEELDKVEDDEGKQLEAVIRYFKNLFTQAPALFFFLTDKQYFDHVSTRIAEARRKRTYAVEHTFFTNRVFVNRPSVEDCLAYLEATLSGPGDRAAVRELAEADRRRVRGLDQMSEVEKFLRVLLFRSQGHFFDLKNEMRRFVRVGPSGSVLEFDERSFPRAESELAAFQFVTERCARAYRFGVGQEYADEALRSSLALVFAGMGTSDNQVVADLLGGDEALTVDERRHIEQAVHSLLEDLHRGDVFEYFELSDLSVDGEAVPESFAWRRNAGAAFVPSAPLVAHEQALLADLARLERTIGLLVPGPFAGVIPPPASPWGSAADMWEALGERRRDLEASATQLTTEEAARKRIEAEQQAEPFVDALVTAHRERLTAQGFLLSSVSGTRRDPLWSVAHGELHGIGRAPVLLAYGSGPSTVDALRRFAGTFIASDVIPEEEQRIAVVVVEDDPAPPGEVAGRVARWRGVFEGTPWEARASVALVPIDEGLSAREAAVRWGERTVDELLFAWLWVHQGSLLGSQPKQPLGPGSAPLHRLRSGGDEVLVRDLSEAVARWVDGTDRVLMIARTGNIDDTSGLGLPAVGQVFAQAHGLGTPVVYLPSAEALRLRNNGPLGLAPQRLMQSGRTIVGVERDQVSADGLLSRVPTEAVRLVVDATHAQHFQGPSPVATLRDDDRVLFDLARAMRDRDPAEADALLRLAAESGDIRAACELVVELNERDPPESQRWRDEVLRRRPDVEPSILRTLALRIGGVASGSGGVLLEASAERGDTDAMEELLIGSLRSDPAIADMWERRLVGTEPTAAMRAAHRLEGIDRDRAVAMYKALAGGGNVDAAGRLLVLLALSDPEGADYWLQRFVDRADSDLKMQAADDLDPIDQRMATVLRDSVPEATDEPPEPDSAGCDSTQKP